jgi:hypothetical protein
MLALIATIGHIMTGIGTVILVVLIVKTLHHMKAATKFTEIQTNYKFRPWVGPTGSIRQIDEDDNNIKFEITLKNYGDLPAASVIVRFIVSNEKIMRENLASEQNTFNLGPILPNMEKHYWLYVSKRTMQNALDSNDTVRTGVYFEYESTGTKNGYGMISELNPKTKVFVHKEMWVDAPFFAI